MSPLPIVRDVRHLIQTTLLPSVPRKWHEQLSFGLKAYAFQTFQSATSNARRVVANPNTAARKSERLLANQKLAHRLGRVCDQLGLVKSTSYVNVDHSDMHGLTALVGAVQTRNGRAIPCFVETTYALHIPAPGSRDSTPRWQGLRRDMVVARKHQSFTGHTIDALQSLRDRLGFWPKLVFDRGFGNESIVEHLCAEGATFYVRLKAGRYVECGGERAEVKHLADNDATVHLFGTTLRVIRSPKSRRAKEPWYILTNDHTSSRHKIVRIYYHRFEIEETFKDTKHVFEFDHVRLTKPNSLKVLLWCMFLGIAILYKVTRPTKHSTQPHSHHKKRISWIRQALEQLHQAYGLVLWGEG